LSIGDNKRFRSYEIGIIDENSSYLGVDRRILMENAGAAVARVAAKIFPTIAGARILVVAGPGNNGGDAFVAARHLAGIGGRVTVILLSRPETIRTPEALANWSALECMRLSVRALTAPSLQELATFEREFSEADLIIDGIFGTGVKGEIREPYRRAIELINSSKATIVSIDVPSGMDPDTGDYATAVSPTVTVTLHGLKPFVDKVGENAGRVVLEQIGAPPEAELIAGPGDLSYSLSCLKNPKHATVVGAGPIVEGAADTLKMLGVSARLKIGGSRFRLEVEGVTVSRAPMSGELFDVYLGSMNEGDARELARMLGRPVYLAGGWDAISDGENLKSNWIEKPADSDYVIGASSALAAAFIASGAEPIYAISGAVYAARRALRYIDATGKTSYLDALYKIISKPSKRSRP